DQPNAQYILDTDINVPGTAFVVGAGNVTLNLNGHQVVFGEGTPLQVANGSFEQGPSGPGLPGWDLGGAPAAAPVPAMTGMYGQWMLQFSNISSKQTLFSDPVAIPQANREYAAAVTAKGPWDAVVQLSVVDAVTNTVLATGTSPNPERGMAAVATF